MLRRWSITLLALLLLVSSAAFAAEPMAENTVETALLRGDFAALLVEAAGLEGEGSPADVLIQHGIMNGVPGKNADAGRPIKRVEAAALLGRTIGISDGVMPPPDADITLPPSHWAYGSYAWLTRLGLVAGDPEAVLSPDEGAWLVKYAFEPTTEDVLAILEQSQQQSLAEEASRLQVALDGKIQLIPRPGVEGAEEIQSSLTPELHVLQTMVLPDKIHQLTTMKIGLAGLDAEEIVSESYIVAGGMYQQLPDPETGETRWYKYPAEMMPDMEQLIEQAQQQAQVIPAGLEKTTFYKLLGTKECNGKQVYELSFYSRIDDIPDFLSKALSNFGGDELLTEALSAAGNMVDTLSIWGLSSINVDDHLPHQTTIGMTLTLAEEFLGEAIPLQAIEFLLTSGEYRYGEEIEIVVPGEVLAAPEYEFPGLDFDQEFDLDELDLETPEELELEPGLQ
ncbi:MAG TPA: DUF6612 family protein [bacterium]|nr:DUF6612 family protein [bacterium]